MVNTSDADLDPSVCYRHPDRSSWTLCTRCGKTICPECQILTPAGVQCPDCVRETQGVMRWESTNAGAVRAKKAARTAKTRERVAAVRSTSRPLVTITTAALSVVLWIVGFATANLPFTGLAAAPQFAWQIWRYVTASIAYPSVGGVGILSVLLSVAIFVYIGWNAERQFGRTRYLGLLLVSGSGGAAIAVLAGGIAYGTTGVIWGIIGAYLISVWSYPAVRNRLLITTAIWFAISLFIGGNIPFMIGGAASGIGAFLLLRRYEDRPRAQPWVPYLMLAGAIAGIALLAILRSAFLS
ncbi:rhomboid family intramembrane serine protease [soil metagenome]